MNRAPIWSALSKSSIRKTFYSFSCLCLLLSVSPPAHHSVIYWRALFSLFQSVSTIVSVIQSSHICQSVKLPLALSASISAWFNPVRSTTYSTISVPQLLLCAHRSFVLLLRSPESGSFSISASPLLCRISWVVRSFASPVFCSTHFYISLSPPSVSRLYWWISRTYSSSPEIPLSHYDGL